MPTLQFAYAGTHAGAIPATVNKTLSPRNWRIASCTLDTFDQLTHSPDFLWVDFGRSPNLSRAGKVINHLAIRQKESQKSPFVFISGSNVAPGIHHRLVDRIYRTMPYPDIVVADLAGSPDLGAIIRKFLAQLKAENPKGRLKPKLDGDSGFTVAVPNADLRSERGRLSIRSIADLFDMDVIEIGRLIGRENKAALSKTPDAESLQALLQPFADIALLRAPDFGDEQFRKWLHTPNEHMRNRSPLDWIRDGRVHDVAGFVLGILTGEPT